MRYFIHKIRIALIKKRQADKPNKRLSELLNAPRSLYVETMSIINKKKNKILFCIYNIIIINNMTLALKSL